MGKVRKKRAKGTSGLSDRSDFEEIISTASKDEVSISQQSSRKKTDLYALLTAPGIVAGEHHVSHLALISFVLAICVVAIASESMWIAAGLTLASGIRAITIKFGKEQVDNSPL